MTTSPQPPPAAPPSDEISLRELYLVLRRRAVWIVLAAALAALLTFAFLSLRQARYVAEGTAAVARAPLQLAVDVGASLRFTPEVSVTFDTYQTLALSRGVLEQVLPHHEAEDLFRLEAALELERIAGTATQPSTFLAVAHRVTSRDPEAAARTAAVWIDATMATVRELMLENLDALEDLSSDALADARERVATIELAIETLLAEAAPDALRRQITALDVAVAELTRARVDARRERDAFRAEREALAATGATGAWVVLSDAPEVAVDIAGAIASLDARIAAASARIDGTDALLAELRGERADLARARAEVHVQVAALERELAPALQAVDLLASVEPNVAYVAQIVSASVRVLSEPTVPARPEPTRAQLIALLAAIVTAFAGVVLALLAEAVRAPHAAAPMAAQASRQ